MENQLQILFESADRHFHQGKPLESLFCYHDILQNPEATEKSLELAYWGAGESLMNLGLFGEAVPYLKESLKRNDEDFNYHYLLADCYLKLLKPQEAQAHLLKSLDLNPQHPELLRALGWSYILQRKSGQGINLLKKSLSLEKDNVRTLCDLAVAYMNLHNHRQSQEIIERAKKISPRDPIVLDIEAANKHFAHLTRDLPKSPRFKTKDRKETYQS